MPTSCTPRYSFCFVPCTVAPSKHGAQSRSLGGHIELNGMKGYLPWCGTHAFTHNWHAGTITITLDILMMHTTFCIQVLRWISLLFSYKDGNESWIFVKKNYNDILLSGLKLRHYIIILKFVKCECEWVLTHSHINLSSDNSLWGRPWEPPMGF